MKLYITTYISWLSEPKAIHRYLLVFLILLRVTLVSGQADLYRASTPEYIISNTAKDEVNGPACTEYTSRATDSGLGADLVISTYAKDNTIYAGTGGSVGGVAISTDGGSTFTNRNYMNSGLGGNFVLGVYALDGILYAATDGGLGISIDGGLTFSNKTTQNGLGDGYISGVHVADDVIYAATGSGLSISIDGGNSFVNKTTSDGLGNNFLLGVTKIDGILYAATIGGVSISMDGGNTFLTKTTTDGLGDNVVNKIHAVGSTIYAATYGGLSISADKGTTWTNKTTADGLGNDRVNSVFAIGNTVYAATEGGLSISTNGGDRFTNYTTLNGLGGVPVTAVYATDKAIYAGTRGGGISFCPGSDLTPILYARPAPIYGSSSCSVVVDVVEINSVPTSGMITAKVTKDAKTTLVFDNNLTRLAGRSVQNSSWTFSSADPNYYVLTTTQPIAAGDVLSFGLSGVLNPGGTVGSTTSSVTLLGKSGGEVRPINNFDADKTEYFQQ